MTTIEGERGTCAESEHPVAVKFSMGKPTWDGNRGEEIRAENLAKRRRFWNAGFPLCDPIKNGTIILSERDHAPLRVRIGLCFSYSAICYVCCGIRVVRSTPASVTAGDFRHRGRTA